MPTDITLLCHNCVCSMSSAKLHDVHKTWDVSWDPLFDQHMNVDLTSLYVTEVYPKINDVFKVFEMPVQDIRIVLLGQDPYHGPNQAHGLSFSVTDGITTPPSLRNMYREILEEFPERNYVFKGGNLEKWHGREKIFLLNSALTVVRGKPGSHMDEWKQFTDKAIQYIAQNNTHCVFLLLGNYSKSKSKLIPQKNKIVQEVHPSPMAQGFVGSSVFKRVEAALGEEVCWSNTDM